MGWFHRHNDEDGHMADQFTEKDRVDFSRLNAAVTKVAKAAKAVAEAGKALREIRERQLFRHVASSWESYLALHDLTRRRADQIVAAAGVLEAVEAVADKLGTTVPTLSERAIRPLVGLDDDAVADAMAEAAGSPGGITPSSIRKAAGKRKAKKVAKAPKPKRFRVPGAIVVVQLNAKAVAAGISLEDALKAALDVARQNSMQAEAA